MVPSSKYAAEKLKEAAGYIRELKPVAHAVKSAASRPGPVTENDVANPALWAEYKQLRKELDNAAESVDSYSLNDLAALAERLDDLASRL